MLGESSFTPMVPGSQTELRIGLIGVGRHGSRYIQHLVHDMPGVVLTALCRRSGGGTLAGTDIPVYSDYRAMIADPRVQAVVVVTPPSLCHDICLTSVQAAKPILIEKPLALNGSEARAMVTAANRRGIILMTAQTLRFDPTILCLKEQIRTIGRLRSAMLISHIETKANAMPGKGGSVPLGALLEIGIHLLDLVRFVTGEPIVEVQCTTDSVSPESPETYARARLRTSGGIICSLDTARVESRRVGRVEWVGDLGTVTADWTSRTVTRIAPDGSAQEWSLDARPTVLATLQAFVHAVRTGSVPPVTGLDGCLAVEAADACYRSAARAGAVVSMGDTAF